jgi:hypothetical protein
MDRLGLAPLLRAYRPDGERFGVGIGAGNWSAVRLYSHSLPRHPGAQHLFGLLEPISVQVKTNVFS